MLSDELKMPLPRIDLGMMMMIGIDNNDNNIDNSNLEIHIDNIHIDNRRHTFFISFVIFIYFCFLIRFMLFIYFLFFVF